MQAKKLAENIAAEAVGGIAKHAIGALVGGAIGSVVPGIGSIMGAVAGAVIGGVCQYGIKAVLDSGSKRENDLPRLELPTPSVRPVPSAVCKLEVTEAPRSVENPELGHQPCCPA